MVLRDALVAVGLRRFDEAAAWLRVLRFMPGEGDIARFR